MPLSVSASLYSVNILMEMVKTGNIWKIQKQSGVIVMLSTAQCITVKYNTEEDDMV